MTTSHCSKSYVRRDWAGREQDRDTAYCTLNHKEFFTELSVAYLCDAYIHLETDNEKGCMMTCSPPFLNNFDEGKRNHSNNFKCFSPLRHEGKSHCNKFFPFTRQQLRSHDPPTYSVLKDLWLMISSRDDPEKSSFCNFFQSCWKAKDSNSIRNHLLPGSYLGTKSGTGYGPGQRTGTEFTIHSIRPCAPVANQKDQKNLTK